MAKKRKKNNLGIDLRKYRIRKIDSWKELPKKYYQIGAGDIYTLIFNFEKKIGRKIQNTIYTLGILVYIDDKKFIEEWENPLKGVEDVE